MEWLSQNWVWVLFFAAFIAMHLFGHGGHGSHGSHGDQGGGRGRNSDDATSKNKDGAQATPGKSSGHQH